MAGKRIIISNRARAAAWLAMTLAVLLAGLRGSHPCSPIYCRLAGLVLLAASLRGAAVTGRYLAVYGNPVKKGRGPGEPTRLVREGPYSCMRHPMHFFLSLFPLSLGLLAATSYSITIGLVEAATILLLAATLDEQESLARFGRDYEEYRRTVPPFNPDPRCLAKALGPRPPKRKIE